MEITNHQYKQAKKCLNQIEQKGDQYNEKKYYLEQVYNYEKENNMLTSMGEQLRLAELKSCQ